MMTFIKNIFNFVWAYFALRKTIKYEHSMMVSDKDPMTRYLFRLDEHITENDSLELRDETELKKYSTASKENLNKEKEGLRVKVATVDEWLSGDVREL